MQCRSGIGKRTPPYSAFASQRQRGRPRRRLRVEKLPLVAAVLRQRGLRCGQSRFAMCAAYAAGEWSRFKGVRCDGSGDHADELASSPEGSGIGPCPICGCWKPRGKHRATAPNENLSAHRRALARAAFGFRDDWNTRRACAGRTPVPEPTRTLRPAPGPRVKPPVVPEAVACCGCQAGGREAASRIEAEATPAAAPAEASRADKSILGNRRALAAGSGAM